MTDLLHLAAELAPRRVVNGVNYNARGAARQFIPTYQIDLYRNIRVPLVWVVDPHDRTVTIYRLDREPELVNIRQELTAEPFLPGLRVAVAEIFCVMPPRSVTDQRTNRAKSLSRTLKVIATAKTIPARNTKKRIVRRSKPKQHK